MNKYVGHASQIRGAEEHILKGGKGEGMRLLTVRNGKGLDFTISLDRAADISRLSFKGTNMGYFAPCGYVAPSYYNGDFLKSFTAGFFTTCGLTTVGTPTLDDGEDCPLHGTISNIPAEKVNCKETDDGLEIYAEIVEASLFGRKMTLKRTYFISYEKNEITLSDEIVNDGGAEEPVMVLYHCNMGYPLLSENSEVVIPNSKILPRNEDAAKGISDSLKMEKPQKGYVEQCFYYDVNEKDGFANAGIYSPDENVGVVLSFDKKGLDYFTEWKMMGETEYVLGLEPGNCTPDGRSVLRERGELKFLAPGESYKTLLKFKFFNERDDFLNNF